MRVFLSYSWKDRETADVVDKELRNQGVDIIRDERDLQYKQNINEYMQRIKESDFAILLISDGFLKSPNCMFEVLELLRSPEFEKRVLPIYTTETNIFAPESRSDYIQYWDKKSTILEAKLRNQTSIGQSQSIMRSLDHYKSIRASIDEFMDHLVSHLHFFLEDLRKLQYGPLLEHVTPQKKKHSAS